MDKKVEIYCCYAHKDDEYLQKLKTHFSPFLRDGSILFWDDTNISPGALWQDEVNMHLKTASIVLLLVSADFMNSDYYYSKEMTRAMQRHEEGTVCVIPIILRPVAWQKAPFGKFRVLPTGAKAVVLWENIDQGFLDIVQGIAKVAHECIEKLHPTRVEGEVENSLKHGALEQLEHIIQNFKLLRSQIASYVQLKRPDGFNLESCESQYSKLYGDTMVFLALYLPERVADDTEGFVDIVYRKTAEQLRRRGDISVSIARYLISSLAKLEKVAAQIDACTVTLESYKQKYFTSPPDIPAR